MAGRDSGTDERVTRLCRSVHDFGLQQEIAAAIGGGGEIFRMGNAVVRGERGARLGRQVRCFDLARPRIEPAQMIHPVLEGAGRGKFMAEARQESIDAKIRKVFMRAAPASPTSCAATASST